MCRKSLILSMLALGLLVGSAQAQLITGLAHRNTDTDAPETPLVGAAPLAEGSVTFLDRVHIYKDVPDLVLGAEYIMLANDNKNQGTYELDVTVSKDATIFVFVDNRMGGAAGGKGVNPIITGMPWLTSLGFVDTGADIGIDESADGSINQYFSIFALDVKRGTITLGGCTSGHSGNMLGVAAKPRMSGSLASEPMPDDGAKDVPRDVQLRWTAGEGATVRNVYLGVSFADVNDAALADAVSQGQADAAYQPKNVLAYGQTYYWRVDEVNSADGKVTKGLVWTFTVEPYAYPIANVTATASSGQPSMGPEKTVDGSGLDATGLLHSSDPKDMWTSGGGATNWIQFQFDAAYKLHEMWVWNSNQLIEGLVGFGAKTVKVEYSVDGAAWTELAGASEFNRAPGQPGASHDTTVDFGGVVAKYVKVTILASWGGLPTASLSEVRFFFIPVQAREPVPGVGAAGVDLDAVLTWRPGREAASHKVYFGADVDAVTAGTAAAQTVTDHSFNPSAVEFGKTYYWRVDEVNNAETPSVYEGAVWSYITREYAVIDDFEGYTDDEGSRIYESWTDGVTDGKSGSTVGYLEAPFAERKIIHAGKQSMPLQYDNSAGFSLSEAELAFDTAQNWTGNGADSFVLWFRGQTPGFVELPNGNILMNGVGADIWGTSDAFRLAYKSLNGDGTIVARVESISNSNAWAKGGVMIRQSIEPGSVHAFMPITPGGSSGGNGASFQRRLTAGGDSTNNDNTGAVVAAPYWVKVERKGNAFSGFISPDGKTWTQLGTAQMITMTGPVLIGLALCSHDAAVPTGAEFSNVAMTGNVTGAWQVAEIGVAQPAGNSVEGLYLSVKDSAGKTKVVQHPNAAATGSMSWQEWKIPLSEFTSAGVKMNAVKSLVIGVGNKAAPVKGGVGTVYIDDIGFGRPIAK
ncbi:MAG: hypothetical protein GX448_11845 [Planctomycetes bacterium]|nr:hypothetical protein [Planctomycetota bacterium]